MNVLIKMILLFLIPFTLEAGENYLIKFELVQSNKTVEKGSTFVTQKQSTWKKGYKRSYTKLSCRQPESGKIEKRITAVEHFAGLLVTHQLIGDKIELNVVRNMVTSRLKEIRSLPKKACKALSPIVDSHTETYHILARHEKFEIHPFGDAFKFHIKVQAIRKIR